MGYTPEWASEGDRRSTADLIRESARFYAKAERGAIQWGLAFDTQNDSIQLCQTVSDIMSVCGNIDKPGTNLLVRNGVRDQSRVRDGASMYCRSPEPLAKKCTYKTLQQLQGKEPKATCTSSAWPTATP